MDMAPGRRPAAPARVGKRASCSCSTTWLSRSPWSIIPCTMSRPGSPSLTRPRPRSIDPMVRSAMRGARTCATTLSTAMPRCCAYHWLMSVRCSIAHTPARHCAVFRSTASARMGKRGSQPPPRHESRSSSSSRSATTSPMRQPPRAIGSTRLPQPGRSTVSSSTRQPSARDDSPMAADSESTCSPSSASPAGQAAMRCSSSLPDLKLAGVRAKTTSLMPYVGSGTGGASASSSPRSRGRPSASAISRAMASPASSSWSAHTS
mmetsp:Transcript_4599/g.15144  ORF Transcript_4599/g.15144 Transcript_4599/m.15144 type:complete len:263 (-) Transcript_4599:726-1514(-)